MLTQLGRSLTVILSPLRQALDDPSRLETLLAAAGWPSRGPVTDAAVQALSDALGVTADLETLASLAGDDDLTVLEAADAVAAGSRVLARLHELATADPATLEAALEDAVAALPSPMNDTETLLLALGDCADLLVAAWLRGLLPPVASALRLGGVTSGRVPERIDWSLLPRLFSEPGALLRETYGWGGVLPLTSLEAAIRAAGELLPVPFRVATVDPVIWERYWGADAPISPSARQYELTLIDTGSAADSDLAADVAIVVVPVPEGPDADPAPTRLLLAPVARAGATADIELGGWTASVTAGADLTGTSGLVLVPTEEGGIRVERETGAPDLDFDVALAAPELSWSIGDPGAPRLELGTPRVRVGVRDAGGTPEPFVEVGGTLAFVVAPDSDGFLRHILGTGLDGAIEAAIDVSPSGVRVNGAAGSSVVVPLRIPLGPLWIEVLVVRLDVEDDSIALVAAFDLTLVLGPFSVGVNGIGLELLARPAPDGDGTLGGLDLVLAFSPPHRIWFVIDTEAVSGGGFLERQGDRWVGGLSLDILAIGIDAFTIIDTSLPGKPDGFALFATLTLRFPSVPLGFGFSLSGLGGILALNRGVDAEALALALRDGAADAVLFPQDPLLHADTLVEQIDEFFPILEGNTVVGPVAEVSWGVGGILTGQLGIVISLPQGLVIVLGSLEVVLPDRDAPILEIHLDTLGALDSAGGTLLVVASLYDSRLLGTIELSGDAAVYASWLTDPYFLLSVGGFHPGFTPPGHAPAVLEDLRKMRAEVTVGLGVTASLESYFAVTSNTVQFGGGFEIEASADFLSVTYTARGWFEFDVLIKFAPFTIRTDASAGVGVYAGDKELLGVTLAVHLQGPDPWYASGYAQFKFFLVKVRFDFAVGSRAAPVLRSTVDVMDLARQELAAPAAWSAQRASGVPAGVRFAGGEGSEAHVRPDDRLVGRQTVVPLGRRIQRFGELTPEQEEMTVTSTAVVDGVTGESLGSLDITDETDWFAPALYDVMEDQARLAAPSYEQMIAGVGVGTPGVGVPQGDRVTAPAGHETEVWEPERGRSWTLGSVDVVRDVEHIVTASAGGRTARSARGRSVDLDRITVAPQKYVVVDPLTGSAASEPMSFSEAHASARITGNRVVPRHAAART